MRGKRVIDRGRILQKIRAAVEARAGRDFFIVARTDALAVRASTRPSPGSNAARAAGAERQFHRGTRVASNDSPKLAADRRAPNVANMIEGGKTPVLPRDELTQLGFQLILYPLTGLFAAARSIEQMYQKLRADGTTLGEEHRVMSFSEFNELIGVDEKYALAERFGAI